MRQNEFPDNASQSVRKDARQEAEERNWASNLLWKEKALIEGKRSRKKKD